MVEFNLSKAVRSNLLSLQSTAASMARTQERLATGLKVNSALDNPTNFFTAASLNSRASDMANLLDSMSNGVKTIEAADNGLSAITKTVESMQSTLRQARQDKSFKTESFAIDPAVMGDISFTGGAVGTSAVNITVALGTPAPSTVAASADYSIASTNGASYSFAFVANTTAWAPGDRVASDVRIDGGMPFELDVETQDLLAVGNGDNIVNGIEEFTAAINNRLTRRNDSDQLVATHDGTNIIVSTADTSVPHTIQVTMANGQYDGGGNINHTYGFALQTGAAGTPKRVTISNGTTSADIVLHSGNAASAGAARSAIQSQLTAQGVTGVTVGGTGNRIDLEGAADGSNSLSVGGPDAAAIFGSAPTTTPGMPAGALSVDQIADAINANAALIGKVHASNDAGKLRIQNISTQDLTIEGVGSDGEIDGSTGTTTVGGNDVRANLAKQFNDLRDQLDKFADDASFNGINLLRGDKLKLTFNETGTSTIDIQAKDADGDATSVSNLTLGITTAEDSDLDGDDSIDARLGVLSNALGNLRSLASSFGSNLSIVENRTDFTRKMINTLETGAAELTLADTNQEAANLLALQTRQQLSSTALSMASQADQAVLRLF